MALVGFKIGYYLPNVPNHLRRMSVSWVDESNQPRHAEGQEGNVFLNNFLVKQRGIVGADRGFEDIDVVLSVISG
jgi:hypothetical protein